MRHPAARLKGLKESVWVLRDIDTQQYISIGDEQRAPRLAPLYLATIARDTPEDLAALQRLASLRLAPTGARYDLERVDAL
jgi:hypothetical protein